MVRPRPLSPPVRMRCLVRWGVPLGAELLHTMRYDRRTKTATVRVTAVGGHVELTTLSLVVDDPEPTPPFVIDREAFLRP